MTTKFTKFFQILIILSLLFGFNKPTLASATASVGAIWTNNAGCSSSQNVNQYKVGDTVYVHYSGFEPGSYTLTVVQIDGNPKVTVEGPTKLTLGESGCFAAHTVEASEAGHEFTVDLGKGHNDNYRVKSSSTTPTTTPTSTSTVTVTPTATETTPAPTEVLPTETEATPTATETTPVPTKVLPTETEATPTATETTPVPTEVLPTETETTPTATETTPVPTEALPTETEATPATTETTPVPTGSAPTATETTPAPTDVTPTDAVPTATPTTPEPVQPTVEPTQINPVPSKPQPQLVIIPVTGKAKPVSLTIPVTGNRIIVAGFAHTCMTVEDGRVVCWGLNASGQVGNDTYVDQYQPVYVKNLTGVINLTAGSLHTCALTSENEIWCWGENGSGQLGNGTTVDSSIPVKVADFQQTVVDFTAGEDFTCAKLINNEVWCWGENSNGQLNDGTNVDRSKAVQAQISDDQLLISGGLTSLLGGTFSQVNLWSNASVSTLENVSNPLSISANRWINSGCAVEMDGSVRCWQADELPEMIDHTQTAFEVGTGFEHACTLNDDLTVSCWGTNVQGQLGNGTNLDSSSANLVSNLANVSDLAVGANHTCVLQGSNQAALCWGENNYGQLGINSTIDSNLPLWVYPPVAD